MASTTVTPKYINGPQAGKKWASINADGVYYSFDPAVIPMSTFQKGVAIGIQYETKPYNGKDYHTIKSVVQIGGGGAASYTTNSSGGSGAGNYRQAMDPAESMKVTRLAIAKSCIEGNQQIAVAEAWLKWVLEGNQNG